MREIGHFVGGKAVKGTSGRFGDVFDPNTGEVQAKVALAKHSEVEHAIANARGGAARPGRRPIRSAAPASCSNFSSWSRRNSTTLAKLLSSEHGKTVPDATRRHPARPGSGRICLRHSASAEGRIHRRRRARHRSVFRAPAARRCRRHHAIQFSGNDSDVEIRASDCLRQCLHPQAVRTRSFRPDASC